MNTKKIIFGKPYFHRSEIQEVVKTLRSGWVGTGRKTQIFEDLFRKYKNCRLAVAVNSCTSALHLSLLALDIKKGDEVIVPTYTFAATVNSVVHTGASPVFVDCEKYSMNIDADKIESRISPKTKAIIVVHMAGAMCEMDKIIEIGKKHKLKIIEDCAHALEASYKGKGAGTFGEFGCFSFYATKNITTAEGGMLISNKTKYHKFIKCMSLHGLSADAWSRFSGNKYRHYKIIYPGYKYNMTDLQASLGIHQIKKIDKYWRKRNYIWNIYNRAFKDLPVIIPHVTGSSKHACHLYSLILETSKIRISRDEFIDKMSQKKIGTGVHYIPVHMHPFYRKNFPASGLKNSEWISKRTVSLPISPFLKKAEINRIIKGVTDILEKNRIKA